MWRKVYIDVLAEHQKDGKVYPHVFIFDGREYVVERNVGSKPCAAMKAGGHGIRYEVLVRGQTRHLFREEDKWFIEYNGPALNEEDGA